MGVKHESTHQHEEDCNRELMVWQFQEQEDNLKRQMKNRVCGISLLPYVMRVVKITGCQVAVGLETNEITDFSRKEKYMYIKLLVTRFHISYMKLFFIYSLHVVESFNIIY